MCSHAGRQAHLPGDGFQQSSNDVALAGVAGQAQDDAARIAAPVGRQQPAEGGNKIHTCSKKEPHGSGTLTAC